MNEDAVYHLKQFKKYWDAWQAAAPGSDDAFEARGSYYDEAVNLAFSLMNDIQGNSPDAETKNVPAEMGITVRDILVEIHEAAAHTNRAGHSYLNTLLQIEKKEKAALAIKGPQHLISHIYHIRAIRRTTATTEAKCLKIERVAAKALALVVKA